MDQDSVDRVYGKITTVKSSYLKFWQVVIALIAAWIAYMTPTFVLIIKNKIREMEKENEKKYF